MGDTIQLTTNGERRSINLQKFYKINSNSFGFRVKAQSCVHIILTEIPSSSSEPLYQIHLGASNNTFCKIIKNRNGSKKASANTPEILSPEEFRGFWLKFANKRINVYVEGSGTPFMECTDDFMPNFKFISFANTLSERQGRGSNEAHWLLEVPPTIHTSSLPLVEGGDMTWKASVNGQIPDDAFIGAIDDHPLYVARARHNGSFTPGLCAKVIPHALISWGGQVYTKDEFEVLCGYKLRWQPTTGENKIPSNAVFGGSEQGKPLFITRGVVPDGHVRLGKFHPSYKTCYLPYKSKEVELKEFDILVKYQDNVDEQPFCEVLESDEENEDHAYIRRHGAHGRHHRRMVDVEELYRAHEL